MQTASFHLLPLLFGNVVVTTGQFCSWEHQMAQTICLQRPCGRWLWNQMRVPGGLLARWLVLLQSLSFGFLVSKVGLVVTTSWNRLAIRFSDFSVYQTHSEGWVNTLLAPLQFPYSTWCLRMCVFTQFPSATDPARWGPNLGTLAWGLIKQAH